MSATDLFDRMPALHPGPLAAYAGGTDKRLVLTFELAGRPFGRHQLGLRLYALQGPVPDLDIEVNGRHGVYFPDVRRMDRSDVTGVSPIAGWADVVVPIEADWLAAGANRVAITTTSLGSERILAEPHPELSRFWGSAISYASIWMEDLEAEVVRTEPTVTLHPLPLYVEAGDALAELVDVVVDDPRWDPSTADAPLSVVLEVAGHRVAGELTPQDRAFGQRRARLRVPELPGPRSARVTVQNRPDAHTSEHVLRPRRKWSLHLLPHVHLDLGYTDYQAKVAEIHTRNVDRVLDILDDRPDYAYSIDGSYVVDQYMRTRSDAAIERLRGALTAGRVSVNAFYALFLTGLATLEECFRAGRHAATLRREHGVPLDYANLTDVPSYSGALPTILRAMGIDSFLGIQNHGRAANEQSDELHLLSPFRWRGPDGSEVVAFFSDCYAQLRWLAGYPVSVAGAAQSFSRFVERFDREDYLPHDLPIVGIYSDNEDLADGEVDFVSRWNRTYAYPRLRFSTVNEYFAAIRSVRDQLPTVSGDGGSYWEDGVGAGAAIVARYRRAQVGLAAAETIAALVSTHDPDLRPSLTDFDQAWDALLVGCEHTWTWMHANQHPHGDQSIDQLAWKRHHVEVAHRVATDETRRSLSQLGELVTTDGPTLVVVNALGWERDVEATVELPAGREVQATDGVTVESLGSVEGMTHVLLTVRAVPAFGYRTVPLRPADLTLAEAVGDVADGPALAGDSADLDTGRYRVRVVDGRLTSLWWVPGDRDLLDQSDGHGLADILYVRGGDPSTRTSLYDTDPWLPAPVLDVERARMRLDSVSQSPHRTRLLFTGEAQSIPYVEVEICFRADDDRVDVVARLDKEPVHDKESVYVAFPFAVPDATARYDRQMGWVDPTRDHLPGAGNEWFTTLFGVGLENDEIAIHWTSADAPLFTFRDVVRGRWATRADVGHGTILSWVMNNYWWTNFPPAQQGRVELHYAFRPAPRWDVRDATRFGREVRAPRTIGMVGWLDKMDRAPRSLPAGGGQLLHVRAPDHLVATVVAGRVGPGPVVRLQEVAGTTATAAVTHPGGPGAPATVVTALEDPLERRDADADGVVTVVVEPHEIVSLRLDSPRGRENPR